MIFFAVCFVRNYASISLTSVLPVKNHIKKHCANGSGASQLLHCYVVQALQVYFCRIDSNGFYSMKLFLYRFSDSVCAQISLQIPTILFDLANFYCLYPIRDIWCSYYFSNCLDYHTCYNFSIVLHLVPNSITCTF